MAASDVNTAMTAAAAALASGDHATALTQALIAQGYLAAIPNTVDQQQELQWDHNGIENFIGNLRTAESAAAAAASGSCGIRRAKVTYVRATD